MSGYTPVDQHPVYQQAYYLTTLGFTVFPLHYVTDTGACSCGDSTCTTNAGKHPMVKWSKISSPEMAIQEVHLAIGRYGWCNLGLITGKKRGPAPGIVAIDLDVKDGKNGFEAFGRWCAEKGIPQEAWQQTAWARTGSGGYHFLFLHPGDDIKVSSRANILVSGGGIDVRGDGGYIAVAPSRHKSGRYYEWGAWPTPENLKPLPPALLEALDGGSQFSLEPGRRKPGAYTPTFDDLIDLATELERNKASRVRASGKLLKQALKGEAIVENGGGHDAYRDILFYVGSRWARAEPRETLEHFRQSVEARQRMRPDASCGMENLLDSLVSAQGKAQEQEDSWVNRLAVTAKGEMKACEGNILLVLEHHSEWKGVLAHNDRTQQTMFMRQPPIDSCVGPFPRALTDADGAQMAKWFTEQTRLAVSAKQCLPCAAAIGRSMTYDPFREWLGALPPWDGVPRAEMWLVTCAGAVDNTYTREVSLRWLLQAVYRTFEPGCQADYTLILQGEQGIKKSTLLAALLPDPTYFVDHIPHIGSKDAAISLQGPVIIELAELSTFRRSDSEAMKAFLTTKYDSVRLPYDKLNSMLPRRCVIAGTTNDDAYLRDSTGNRRYWPVTATKCEPELIKANREQLWSELVHRYKAGDKSYLDAPTEALAKAEQEARYEGDAWEPQIDAWLAKMDGNGFGNPRSEGVSLDQVFEHALQIDDTSKWNRGAEMRVVAILKQRKYVRRKKRTSFSNGKYVWVYCLPNLNPT